MHPLQLLPVAPVNVFSEYGHYLLCMISKAICLYIQHAFTLLCIDLAKCRNKYVLMVPINSKTLILKLAGRNTHTLNNPVLLGSFN